MAARADDVLGEEANSAEAAKIADAMAGEDGGEGK
jgi:hypothetical protein